MWRCVLGLELFLATYHWFRFKWLQIYWKITLVRLRSLLWCVVARASYSVSMQFVIARIRLYEQINQNNIYLRNKIFVLLFILWIAPIGHFHNLQIICLSCISNNVTLMKGFYLPQLTRALKAYKHQSKHQYKISNICGIK